MEQESLREHLPRKKIVGIETRSLVGTSHPNQPHPNLAIGEGAHKKNLEERFKQEEILWRQKSCVPWLKEGEKNIKFFHRSMIHRRFINHIMKL
jgi:hypothetical protein